MLKRIMMLMAVAVPMVAMMAVGAGPASAQTVPTTDQITGFATDVSGAASKFASSPITTNSTTDFSNTLTNDALSLAGLNSPVKPTHVPVTSPNISDLLNPAFGR